MSRRRRPPAGRPSTRLPPRVLITGAGRGLGLEFTRRYLERGDRVFASCRRPAPAHGLHALRAPTPVA